MNIEDPDIFNLLHRAKVARIATISRSGRPSVNPLYFILNHDLIWLGTSDWTLASRNVKADPRASLLFNVEDHPFDRRVLRINGRACVRTEDKVLGPYNLRVAFKYLLTPGALINRLIHLRQAMLHRYYRAQNASKGRPCVIEVVPEWMEWVEITKRAG